MLIASLTSSYNRKHLTLKSIGQLYNDFYNDDIDVKHYLVDDCSSDGTPEIVKKCFSDIKIINTSGNLYWSRSMSFGWEQIRKEISPDFLFVYNDDTNFKPKCISKLLETYNEQKSSYGDSIVVVGALVDPIEKYPTYGGRSRNKIKAFTLSSRILPIKNKIQLAYTLNFNAALIPVKILNDIGFISPYFLHGGGDWEFGYRCQKYSIPIIQSPGFVGTCSFNSNIGSSRELNISLFERYKRLLSIKEQPFLPRLNFVVRYGGFLFLLQLFLPYLQIFLFHFYVLFFRKNKINK